MNHLQLLFRSPVVYVGALTLRKRRLEIYESLLLMLDSEGRTSVPTVGEVFRGWAKRERQRGDFVAYVFDYVADKASHSLAEGLRPFIDNEEYQILIAGEIRGDLMYALRALKQNSETQEEMRNTIGWESLVPAASIAALLGMCVINGFALWPDFMRSIPEKYWPGYLWLCVYSNIWLAKHWVWLLVFPLAVVVYFMTRTTWANRARDWFDVLPPWSMYKARLAANTLSMLSALLGAGLTVREAIDELGTRGHPYMRRHMARIIRRYDVSRGDSLNSLRTGFFTRHMLDRVEDAATGRSFDEALVAVSTKSLKLLLRALKVQAAAVAGAVILVTGIAFGYVAWCETMGMQEANDHFLASVQRG